MSENMLFSIGNIIKKESLISIDFQKKYSSLVLESDQPFPGYHGVTLPKSKPDSLYFVTKVHYGDDLIIRAIQTIKKSRRLIFDGTQGTIDLNNKKETVIRIKQVKYEDFSQLLDAFIEQGIEFAKYRKTNSFESIINIRKFFKAKELADNIYHDMNNAPFYYLQVPFLPEWDVFEEQTKNIKYNVTDNNFDAALCSMYNEQGIIDFIRIYDENFQMNKMVYIHEKYKEAFAKL